MFATPNFDTLVDGIRLDLEPDCCLLVEERYEEEEW